MNICGNGICVCDNYEYPDSQCSDADRTIPSNLHDREEKAQDG